MGDSPGDVPGGGGGSGSVARKWGGLGKVSLVQGYQVAKKEVICVRGKLSVWGVDGKMTLLRLY